jgi:peptidoglycan/xylan/chitin deacetylase (PgdA/CDA1 family)
MSKKHLQPFVLLFFGSAILIFVVVNFFQFRSLVDKVNKVLPPQDIAKKYSPPPTSLPSPSPKVLTFEELNSLYGPCIYFPVLFYHHIQNLDVAKAAGQQNLTVATDIFINQMQYLKDKGYNPTTTNAITDFFDKGIVPPPKSILLTFDDGYEDFYVNVLPIIRQIGFKAIIALPTGLTGNPGYLTWDELSQAASSGIEIVNHTWSHMNMDIADTSIIEREIGTADSQLSSRGYNANKVFVFPYGGTSQYAVNYLQNKGYTLGFTTVTGSTLCKKQRLVLPRIRIGNANLSAYGF